MKHFLKLIRFQNLLFLAFMQLVFRFLFLKQSQIDLALTDFNFFLLVVATVSIAAGGYVINNIMDQESDEINKPQNRVVGLFISESVAYNWYIALTVCGVGIGFYLSNVIYKPSFASIFVLIATLLYVYATNLKQIPLLGNIIIALLVALSILIIALFDVYPATDLDNKIRMGKAFTILTDYAIFAFLINLIREIIKDLEDIEGDYKTGCNTLAVAIGIQKTKIFVAIITIFSIVILVYYLKISLLDLEYTIYYALIFILAPLLYFGIKLLNASSSADFHHLSSILKWILFFGVLSVVVIVLNIKYA